MSILIAYIIIGLTFSVSFVATHKHTSEDKIWHYILSFSLVIMIWPFSVIEFFSSMMIASFSSPQASLTAGFFMCYNYHAARISKSG